MRCLPRILLNGLVGTSMLGVIWCSSLNGIASSPYLDTSLTWSVALSLVLLRMALVGPEKLSIWGLLSNVRFGLERVNRWPWTPWALALLAFAIFLHAKIVEHWTFHTTTYDLMVYSSGLDHPFKPVPLYTEWYGHSCLEFHASFGLYLFLPMYWLWPTPVCLLVLQALTAAAAVVPLYRIAEHLASHEPVAPVVACAFIGNLHLGRGLMYDFHQEILAPVLVLGAFLFLLKRRMPLFWTCVALTLLTKEDFGIYLAGLGFYLACAWPPRRVGVILVIVGLVYSASAVVWIVPSFRSVSPGQAFFLERWKIYGASPVQIVMTLVSQPSLLAQKLFSEVSADLVGPLLFIPLLSPLIAPPLLPFLLFNRTSLETCQANLELHYGLPAVPYVFLAFVLGLSRVLEWGRKTGTPLVGILAFALAWTTAPTFPRHRLTDHDRLLHEIIRSIPPGSSIVAQTTIVPHLGRRSTIHMLRDRNPRSDYVLVDSKKFAWPLSRAEFAKTLSALRSDPCYETVLERDGIFLFRRVQRSVVERPHAG